MNSRSAPYQENLQFEIGEPPFNSNNFNTQNLEEELRAETRNNIADLQEDQIQRFEIEDERVGAIDFIEISHQELQGEHVQDSKETTRLNAASHEIDTEIASRKVKINSEIADIKSQIKDVDNELKVTETQKIKKTKDNLKLQDVLDIPENLEEEGFSKEALSLRKDNSKLKSQFSKGTEDFLKERDERDQALSDHQKTVKEYNNTIYDYFKKLFQTEEAKKIQEDLKNDVLFQVKTIENQNNNLDQMIQIADIDIESHISEIEAIKNDLSHNRQVYNEHITELSDSITEQNREIGHLKDKFNEIEAKNRELNVKVMKQKLDLEDHKKEMDAIEAINYEENANKLLSDLKSIEDVRRKHQDELENAQANLTTKLSLFQEYESHRRREKEEREKIVESNLYKLVDAQENINTIKKSIDEINNRIVSDNNKDIVGITLETEKDHLNLKLRWAYDERDSSRNDIKEATDLLRSKQQEVSDQERQIELLKSEINSLKILIEEKKKIIIELEKEIEKCDERIYYLVKKIEDLDALINELLKTLYERDARIRELENIIGTPAPVDINYKAVKGDEVDEMLALYMKDCPVPVKRLGNGFYLFGTRKIYAKIMNGKLVVRVGGGYMFISEFIVTYSDPEIAKLTKIAENLGVDSIWDLDLEDIFFNKAGRSPVNSPMGNEISPRRGGGGSPSFKRSMKVKGGNASINGTKRAKKFNQSAIVR